jgi:NADH-quinone oxidoreductase subunit M
MPVYAVLSLIISLSSMGLPGLNGFVGEFTILLGSWGAGNQGGVLGSYLFTGFAAGGVILAAIYILFMFQKLFLGPVTNEKNEGLKDLNWREIMTLAPLLVVVFWIGLYPKPFFSLIAPTVERLVDVLQTAAVIAMH